MLLTIGDKFDAHVGHVDQKIKKLKKKNIIVGRTNLGKDWSIDFLKNKYWLVLNKKAIPFSKFKHIWSRRFINRNWISKKKIVSDFKEDQFIKDQYYLSALGALIEIMQTIPVTNHPDADLNATSKFLQINVAKKCGLNVPETVFTKNKDIAKKFSKNFFKEKKFIALKHYQADTLFYGKKALTQLTQKLDKKKVGNFTGLNLCPVIFQEYIEKKYEYRITVTNNKMFTCRIHSQKGSESTKVDWRHYDIENTPHYSCKLNHRLEKKIFNFIKCFNLKFAALDFVEDKQGNFFFLDLNSEGAYLWLEDITNLDISDNLIKSFKI